MPIAGVPRNPEHQSSNRFHRLSRVLLEQRLDIVPAGRAEPGTIRRLIRGLVGYTGAAEPFSWTRNGFSDSSREVCGPVSSPRRFLVSTVNTLTVGNQLSNPMVRPIVVRQRQAPAPPLVQAGNVQGRPTVRNRIRSFGSRVQPLNGPSVDSSVRR